MVSKIVIALGWVLMVLSNMPMIQGRSVCQDQSCSNGPRPITSCSPVQQRIQYMTKTSSNGQGEFSADGGRYVDMFCASDSDCGGFLKCDTTLSAPVCYQPAKTCNKNSSGRGTCVARNINSKRPVNFCGAGDSMCEMSCACDATFGGTHCCLTEAKLAVQQNKRLQYLQSLSWSYVTGEELIRLGEQLSAAAQNSYELTGASVDLINQIANTLLTNATGLEDFTYAEALGVLIALDNAAAATIRMNFTNAAAFINKRMETIALFSDMALSQVAIGQKPAENIFGTFRTSSVRRVVGVVARSVEVLVPSSPFEQYNGNLASSVEIHGSKDGEEEFGVNLLQMTSGSYGESSSFFNSNPLQLTVFRATSAPTRVTFVLAHNEPGNFTLTKDALSYSFTSTCTGLEDRSIYTYTCPVSDEVIYHHCTGREAGVLTSYCLVRAPTCAIVDGTTGEGILNSPDCEIVTFNSCSTTCSCLIQPSAHSRRLSSLKDLPYTGVLNVVSATVFAIRDSLNTFTPTKRNRRRLQSHVL